MQMGEMHAINDVIDLIPLPCWRRSSRKRLSTRHVTIESARSPRKRFAGGSAERPPVVWAMESATEDQYSGCHPQDQRYRRRGRRHHLRHRCLSGQGQRQPDHLPGYPGPRGIHLHAPAARHYDRYRSSGGCCRRRHHAPDHRVHQPRQGCKRQAHRGNESKMDTLQTPSA